PHIFLKARIEPGRLIANHLPPHQAATPPRNSEPLPLCCRPCWPKGLVESRFRLDSRRRRTALPHREHALTVLWPRLLVPTRPEPLFYRCRRASARRGPFPLARRLRALYRNKPAPDQGAQTRSTRSPLVRDTGIPRRCLCWPALL